ncbi:EAL domain-containing protein [Fontimonas sp. SYSU GA230001]|uniref:EAL domain-containing protein n=1 Tax=Fontimonas sp. SYSU GA230001 TaxID=3142450 RepID=UPI0032B524E8
MKDSATQRRLAAGQLLFREGEPGHEAYLVESGAIEIYVERPQGKHVLARLGPDELFGEMALISDEPRSASARAIEPTVLSVITHDTLTDQIDRAPPLLRHLLRVTIRRTRDTLRMVGRARDAAVAETSTPAADSRGGDTPADRDVAIRRLRMEQALSEAMRRHELELFYQPIVRLDGGHVAGFESLVRWRRADGSLVPPGEFVWVLEDSPLILEFGRWTVRAAAEGLKRLQSAFRPARLDEASLFCTVNLSVRQLGDGELIPCLQQALADNGLLPEQLRLEITESAVLNNFDVALELLLRCRDLGCKLIVDDFGTGYSSLSYLHRLPVNGLKLDQSFVRDAATSERGRSIIRAIGRLAEDIGMYTVMEGIETPEQAAWCQDIGLRYGQGYFFGKPMPESAAATMLAAAPG